MAGYADVNIQNGGAESLGPWGGLVRGQIFGLTGLGDRTTMSVFTTPDFKEQQTVQLGHDFRIGSEGLSAGGTFTYAWARPTIPDARVLARTLLGTVEIGYPLVRREAETIRASVGMDYINQDVDLDGAPLTRDRLRVGFLRLGFDTVKTDFTGAFWSPAEPPWRVSALFELRQGLRIFGETDCGLLGAACVGTGLVEPSRSEGQADATVLRYTFNGEVRPLPRITFALGARGQYAWKPLLSFEEFSAGNYTAGRGYDPGTLLGDMGFGTQAEVRVGSRIPKTARSAAVEAYAFWDHAEVRNRDTIPSVISQTDYLDSVGGGARINFDRFALDAAVAVPLTRVGPDNVRPDPRVLVSLTSRLFPWSYR
jgi:hemolysin activation/secretion protein